MALHAFRGTVVAWAGWWLPLPGPWRFLQMQGGYNKGLLVLGDEDRPRLELSWVWVSRKGLNPEAYARRFLLRGLTRAARKAARSKLQPLSLPGFHCSFALEEEEHIRAVGYCAKTNRLLQWVYHRESPEVDAAFEQDVLRHWRDQPLDGPVRWSFFDLDFLVPEGFRFHSATLNLGDMEIVLIDPGHWDGRHRLIVRCLYPAELALARQPISKWLAEIFRKRRGVYRPSGRASEVEPAVWQQPARLPLPLRTLLRPLVFRVPLRAEASLHHLTVLDKLVYLQISGPSERIESTRRLVLDSFSRREQIDP